MPEISKEKRRFLESIGIDINNLPPEFERYSDTMESTLSSEEIAFLTRENLTGRYKKEFCLRDLVGTVHPDYADKTWIEAFLLSKRGESAVEQYFKNPEYYSKGLKQFDQSNTRHETPLELYESDGQFFINGGNNRLSLIMMKYLAEMSKAQTDEERAMIDEKYTFVADVQPTPQDKDIMYMINMLRENYGKDAHIKRTAKDEKSCEYTVKIGDRTIKISSKDELEQALRDTYQLDSVKTLDELKDNIAHLVQDGFVYSARQDQNRGRILDGMFPNLQQFTESFIKLKQYGIESKLYDGIDLQHIDFSKLSSRTIELAEREETRRQEEQTRAKEQQEKEKQERAKQEAKEKAEQESKIKSEKRKKDVAIGLRREHIEQQTTSIPDSVETTYNELKQEEIKFSGLAIKLGLSYSITRTDDTNIYSSIQQIKSNMQRISEQIMKVDDSAKLDKVSGVLQELESLTQAGTIKSEHSAELRATFERSFDAKVQDLIRSSKMSILEQERGQVEQEKVSIIGKLLGKGKLKQAKLDNIDLKMKLLMTEPLSGKISYSLEDSLSDLYTYSHCELGKHLTPEMQQFLGIIKSDPQLKEMIDQQRLKMQYEQKVNDRQNAGQLIPVDEDRRMSNRKKANILQVQNNEMSRQVQNNRARIATRQKSLSSISINSDSPLNRFQSMVNEINLSTQTRETRQQQRAEQESQMQL